MRAIDLSAFGQKRSSSHHLDFPSRPFGGRLRVRLEIGEVSEQVVRLPPSPEELVTDREYGLSCEVITRPVGVGYVWLSARSPWSCVYQLQPGQVIACVLRLTSIHNEFTIADEVSSAAVGRTLWPKRQGMEPRRSAYRRPGVSNVRMILSAFLVNEIQEKAAVWR